MKTTCILLGILTTLAAREPVFAGPLRAFLASEDPAFGWSVRDRRPYEGVTVYTLELTSQEWRGQRWRHQLVVAVPDVLRHAETAFLWIAGGSSDEETGEPRWRSHDRREIVFVRHAARAVGAPAAALFQVPRQPVWGGLYEDAAIALTFQEFLEGAPPESVLLFPMVRSAVRAMDAVQAFVSEQRDSPIRRFVVTGASKRGWTSWLLGASDPRVVALAPQVIDMLNWEKHLDYHVVSFGEHSPMIRDYTEKGLHRMIDTEPGQALARLVDPYSYRARFTMPVQLLLGANDPYWPIDAVKLYADDLPAPALLIHYTPNAGHNLGDGKAMSAALLGFFAVTAGEGAYPLVQGEPVEETHGLRLRIRAGPGAVAARLWTAESESRDFRNSRWSSGDWPLEALNATEGLPVPTPQHGYRAFYVEVDFPSPVADVFPVCTRVFVAGPKGLVD